jgi:hypothetical protein
MGTLLPTSFRVCNWIGTTNYDVEESYLMLTVDGTDALEQSNMLAAWFRLPLQADSGRDTLRTGYVELRGKQWMALYCGQMLVVDSPMHAEWVSLARERKHVIFVVGHLPLAPDGDIEEYLDRIGERCSIGILPVTLGSALQ